MAGFDWGLGATNIDTETGIRYGVIHQNEVLQAWADTSEADYGAPHCPKCGNPAVTFPDTEATEGLAERREGYEELPHCCSDYCCDDCKVTFDGDKAFRGEPFGFTVDDGEYKATCGSDGDIFILSSPFYTFCEFCSPCAPGAGYLTSPGSVKAYCFGHDWFDGGKAPYKVYRVSNNALVRAGK